jgi:hypothetical protein
MPQVCAENAARIFKLLRSPGTDSKESIPPAYVAWQADTTTLFLLYTIPTQSEMVIFGSPVQLKSLEVENHACSTQPVLVRIHFFFFFHQSIAFTNDNNFR